MKKFKNILEDSLAFHQITESTDLADIKGKHGKALTFTQYSGGKDAGRMLQLTQGMKYVQIDQEQAKKLAKELTKWLKSL